MEVFAMTKESLMAMGLTEDQATKVMEALNGSFVPKTRFNEVNTELQTAKATIKERDSQLEALQKSTGDVEALKIKSPNCKRPTPISRRSMMPN